MVKEYQLDPEKYDPEAIKMFHLLEAWTRYCTENPNATSRWGPTRTCPKGPYPRLLGPQLLAMVREKLGLPPFEDDASANT